MITLDTGPRFPEDRSGVAILGCGTIAQSAHLPAYEQHGVGVTGVWSRTPDTTATVRERFPFVGRVYASAEELLADPEVRYVDLATGPEGRLEWIEAAVAAGKHVLAQKPLLPDDTEADRLEEVLARADEHGLRVAVNQNGRWAPPWRLTTRLVRSGAVGEVVGVTHLHDKPLAPLAGTPFDEIPHMLISDYLVHWIDITRCWLEGSRVRAVRASDHRTPGQPEVARNPWSATVQVDTTRGAGALLRIVGDVRTSTPGCPFWIHGTRGTIRGRLLGGDFVELDDGEQVRRLPLTGAWFVDGFAGAMGELMCAIDEGRQPYNSARNNLATLRLVLAARASAEAGGAVQTLDEQL
jgi:predicted dehydrogenase